ncbi:MAG TPA: hypothetical protein VFQ65_32115 [Kofleriaceae bacterium]|nr:hypothetical protein [Kofleriaceae bacterium]
MIDIAAVTGALAAGELDAALAALLASWCETRAPEVAELIGEISARATAQRTAVPRAPRKEAQAAWLARVRDYRPGDLGDLLAALVELLAVGPARFPIPLLDELLALPPDPRIAEALLEALAGPIGGWEDKTYVRLVKLLVRHGDVRLDARFAAAVKKRGKDFLDDDDRSRLAKVPPAWAKQPRAAAPRPASHARPHSSRSTAQPGSARWPRSS